MIVCGRNLNFLVLILKFSHWLNQILLLLWECQDPNCLCYTSLFCAVYNFWMEMHLWFSRIKLSVFSDWSYFCCLTKELELSPLHFFCCFTTIAECGQDWLWSVLCEYAWIKNTIEPLVSPLCPWNLLSNLSHKSNFLFFHPITVVPWSLSDRSKPRWGATQRYIFCCRACSREST